VEIVLSTVDRVSRFVKPDVKNSNDDMDIRKYVHIKKVGESIVVFTTQIAEIMITFKWKDVFSTFEVFSIIKRVEVTKSFWCQREGAGLDCV